MITEEMKKTEENFKSIFNHVNDAIYIFDLNGIFIEVNEIATKHLGFSRDELIGSSAQLIDSPGQAKKMPQRIKDINEFGSLVFESEHVSKKRRVIPVEVNANIITYDDKPCILSVARDITIRKKMSLELKNRYLIERILKRISNRFLNHPTPEKFDDCIDYAFKRIGQFLDVDRVYLFQFSDKDTISNTHEWCNKEIKSQKELLQDQDFNSFVFTKEKLSKLDYILIKDVNDLEENALLEKELLQMQEIKSIIIVPISFEKELIGFIGFDSVRNFKKWEHKDINILENLANIITRSIIHIRDFKIINSEKETSKLYLDLAGSIIIIIGPDLKIKRINKKGADVLGSQVKEVIGKNFFDEFTVPDEKDSLKNIYRGLMIEI